MLVIYLLIIILIFFILIMVIDGNRFTVVHYKIESDKIKKNYRLVLLADLHNKQYGKDHEKLLQQIEKQEPEAILIAGDILTAKPEYPLEIAVSLISKLSRKYPIYYGMGNHETRLFLYPEVYKSMGKDYEEMLKKEGVFLMRNTTGKLSEEVLVTGLEIDRKYYKRFRKTPMDSHYLEGIVGKKEKEKFQILLAHNPDYFEEYSDWGADLVLSGHLHGGMVRLPFLGGVVSPAFRFFPQYDGGQFFRKESRMILSRGLGMHTIPIRVFNPGELVVLHLIPKTE